MTCDLQKSAVLLKLCQGSQNGQDLFIGLAYCHQLCTHDVNKPGTLVECHKFCLRQL